MITGSQLAVAEPTIRALGQGPWRGRFLSADEHQRCGIGQGGGSADRMVVSDGAHLGMCRQGDGILARCSLCGKCRLEGSKRFKCRSRPQMLVAVHDPSVGAGDRHE